MKVQSRSKVKRGRGSARGRALRSYASTTPRGYLRESAEAKFTFIDLFAGIGGFRLALEQLGGDCVFSCEWDAFAQQTYEANFGELPTAGDIRSVDASRIPAHDVLTAGFPCQPFSIAGVSKKRSLGRPDGFEDEKQGNLFFELTRIIEARRPRAFLLENVRNLQSHDKGRTFRIILDHLERQLRYDVHYEVVDARHFVPQHRERVFLVGFDKARDFSFGRITGPEPTLGEILEEEREVPSQYRLSGHLWAYLRRYAAKHRAAGNGFGFGLVRAGDVTRTLSARYYKDGSEILLDRGRGRNPRRLTPRECARLMGFPDTFQIPVSDTQAYKQFGNSVVVPVVQAVASRMIRCLRGESLSEVPQPSLFADRSSALAVS